MKSKHLFWSSRHCSCWEGEDSIQHCEVRTYWAEEKSSVYDCHHINCPCGIGNAIPPEEC